jgi:hypothetical protein
VPAHASSYLMAERFHSGAPVGSGEFVELLDAGGELEVTLSQPTLVVAGQSQDDRVPTDVDVGMVAGRLGRAGNLVDKRHRLGEVLAHEALDDLVTAPLPTGQALQALVDGGVVQPWHGPSFRANAIVRHRGIVEDSYSASGPPCSRPSEGHDRYATYDGQRVSTPRWMNAYQWAD